MKQCLADQMSNTYILNKTNRSKKPFIRALSQRASNMNIPLYITAAKFDLLAMFQTGISQKM
jgi:hypothetical protein